MRKLVSIIAMALLLTLPASAQEEKRPRFNPEEFKAKMETFIAQKAGLTQAESEKLFPIFHEMKQKQRELMQQEQKLKHHATGENDSDKAYQEALMKIVGLHKEIAEVEAAYYKKMCKAITAQKAYRVMKADDAFHREMLKRAEKRPHEKKRN